MWSVAMCIQLMLGQGSMSIHSVYLLFMMVTGIVVKGSYWVVCIAMYALLHTVSRVESDAKC